MAQAVGLRMPPSPPSPLPPVRERGAEGGVRALFPTAYAMGYELTPLTGLRNRRKCGADFRNGLVKHDTNEVAWVAVGGRIVMRQAKGARRCFRSAPSVVMGGSGYFL